MDLRFSPRRWMTSICGTAILLATAAPTTAQRLVGPVVAVSPLSGQPIVGPAGYQPQLSRDGTRVLLVISADPETSVQVWRVLDTSSGATQSSGTTVGAVGTRAAAMSPDGKTVAFALRTNPGTLELRTRDLLTGVETVHGSAGTDLHIDSVSDSGMLGYRAGRGLYIAAAGAPTRWLTSPCAFPPNDAYPFLAGPLRFSGDGRTATYSRVFYRTLPPQAVRAFPQMYSDAIHVSLDSGLARCASAEVSPSLTSPGILDSWPTSGPEILLHSDYGPVALDVERRHVTPLLGRSGRVSILGTSDTGRYVLLSRRLLNGGADLVVLDRITGFLEVLLEHGVSATVSAALSGDGHTAVFAVWPPLGPARPAVFLAKLDAERDSMHDAWETAFGLDSSTAGDASSDLDGDGRTAAEEFAHGTHPSAVPIRYFAEGAHGTFFATGLALFNPGDAPTTVTVRVLGADGANTSTPLSLAAHGAGFLDFDDVALPSAEFSLVLESPVPIVAERRMTWDRASQYGSHAGTGVAAPSRTWYFAEGATIAGLQTFLLVQNPGDIAATVTVHYLLSTATPLERVHVVPARSRLTVWANQEGAPLDAAEFAMTVISSQPVVAERAIYRDAPGEMFSAGSVAAGATAPAVTWNFAEGATGLFFDTYLLLANPGEAPLDAEVEYLPPARSDERSSLSTTDSVMRRYALAAGSRLTIRVADEDPLLADTAVSMKVRSSAPLVAERTMWWPGSSPATWRENHTGGTFEAAGLRWAVADIPVDATQDGWDTFLLVDSGTGDGPFVRVDVACDDGTRMTRSFLLRPHRVTLWLRHDLPEIVGKRCAALVESLPRPVANSPLLVGLSSPVLVEKVMYRGGFTAGSVSMATRLPDPP